MQGTNTYSTEYKRLELDRMMAARKNMPAMSNVSAIPGVPSVMELNQEVRAKRRQVQQMVVRRMAGQLHILGMVAREENGGVPLGPAQVRAWLDVVDQVAPHITAFFFGMPDKAILEIFTPYVTKARSKPQLAQKLNTLKELQRLVSRIMVPVKWAQKISKSFSVTNYVNGTPQYGGQAHAVPVGASAAMSPALSGILTQIAGWEHGAQFLQLCTNISPYTPLLSRALAGVSAYKAFGKVDGMWSIVEEYGGRCSCCELATNIAYRRMGAAADGPMSGHVAALPLAMKTIVHKKAHWVANKFRGTRIHLEPFHIAEGLWQGAQQPARHRLYGEPTPLPTRGRCPVALLAIATLFGGGDPTKGLNDAVDAIYSASTAASNKIKRKIA